MAELCPALKTEFILWFQVLRSFNLSQNVYTLPPNAIITGVMIDGVKSDAGTTAIIDIGTALTPTSLVNAADVKTADLHQSYVASAVLGSVGSSGLQIQCAYAETGTPSSVGGPWNVAIRYIV